MQIQIMWCTQKQADDEIYIMLIYRDMEVGISLNATNILQKPTQHLSYKNNSMENPEVLFNILGKTLIHFVGERRLRDFMPIICLLAFSS